MKSYGADGNPDKGKAYRPKSACMIKVVFLIVWKGRPSQEIITVNIN